ncbi:MAG: AAA family ATPase [Sarcina sp.]
MKPLKLTMQAFANYAGEQVIDFTELNGRNMFLITGKTGAGKTTVFDAISYALFGEPSGDFRSVDSLRSDYANGELETYVELEFELRGEIYKVRRQPMQKLNKKRGEGLRSVEAEARFEIPNAQRPVTGVTAVTKSVIDTLGVTSEQFRQIVMLPQGEFIKLLKAKSGEREVIFRKIFGTEQFNKIQTSLTEKAKKLASELKFELNSRSVFVKKIKADNDSILASKLLEADIDIDTVLGLTNELIQLDIGKAKLLEKESNLNKVKIKKSEDNERLLNNNKATIKSYEEVKKLYEQKNALKSTVDEWRVKLENGKKASAIKSLEENYDVASERFSLAQRVLKESEIEKNILSKQVDEAKVGLEKEKLRNEEKQKLILELDVLSKQENKVTDYDTKKNELLKNEREFLQFEAQIKRLEKSQENEEKSKVECEKYIANTLDLKVRKEEVRNIGVNKKIQIQQVKGLANNFENIRYQQMEFDEKKKEFDKIEFDYRNTKNVYERSEDLFRKAQAGILAQMLIDGEMCPVCGSKEHPLKAVKPSEVLTENELKLLKVKFEEVALKREKALNDLTTRKTTIDSDYENKIVLLATELLEFLGDDFLELTESEKRERTNFIGLKLNNEREDLLVEFKELTAKTELFEQKKEMLEKINKSLDDIKINLNNLKPKYEGRNNLVLTLREQVKFIETEIPEELRSLEKIIEKKSKLEKFISEISTAYDLAENLYSELAQKNSAAIKAIEMNKESVIKNKAELDILKKKFDEILISENFTLEQYKEYKVINDLDLIDNRIKGYDKSLSELKGALGNAQKEFDKLELNDLTQIEELLVKENAKVEELTNTDREIQGQMNVLTNRANHNKESVMDVEKVTSKIKDKENVYKDVEHLSKIARGEGGNEKKITFESYILTSYFDEIIIVANQRLGKMTNGRFELRRTEEVKGGGKKGLELSVLDNNTGNVRGVNSLSGGESFKAALAIALGLADVIQSYAGGISIETMFIDEGFGTLDPDSLDSAIQCLLDLQSGGRLVGVISHVQELKERIEARLEVAVKDDNRGSRAEFVIQ